jgi:hypothetical protein
MTNKTKNMCDFQLAIIEMLGLQDRHIVELTLKINSSEIPTLIIVEEFQDFDVDTKKISTLRKKFELKEIIE